VTVRALAAALAALALAGTASAQGDPAQGRRLFVEGCSTCHGLGAKGIPGVAPDLHGVGGRAADFYLTTGRMPMADPGTEPERAKPLYSQQQIDDLVAYVGSLGGAPVPKVRPQAGTVKEGFRLFSEFCSGCHQVVAQGGVVDGATAPPLQDATPTQIAEAIRVGPYVMPRFSEHEITNAQINSIVRYVLSTRKPDDRGGWGIGHIGPIPEGLVAWLLAGGVLLLVARLIGRRMA
jgi:ubiquinol-cytochrome c reductase cytochrome c subunit